jgi:hypothetical protein
MRILSNTQFYYPDSQTPNHTGRAVLHHTNSLWSNVLDVGSTVKSVLPNVQIINQLTDYMTWRSITVFSTARHESIPHSTTHFLSNQFEYCLPIYALVSQAVSFFQVFETDYKFTASHSLLWRQNILKN